MSDGRPERIVGEPDIGPNGVVESITRKDTKPSIRREAPTSDNWLQLSSRRLQTQVVNDKGRCRSHPNIVQRRGPGPALSSAKLGFWRRATRTKPETGNVPPK